MWVMTSFGILMPGLRPPHTVPAGDNRLLQVRARRRRDLEILRDEYMGDALGEVVRLPHTDYEYRAYCTHEAWAAALAAIAMDVDYVKFKPTTESRYHDPELHGVYNRVWSLLFTALSTPRHQREYWTGAGRGTTSRSSTRSTRTRGGRWWEDLDPTDTAGPGDGDCSCGQPGWMGHSSDCDYGVRDPEVDALLDAVLSSPVLRPSGTLDHADCAHGPSNAARKRCRRRWKRANSGN